VFPIRFPFLGSNQPEGFDMASMKFTQKAVAALTLPEGKSEDIVFDEDVLGFGVRLRRRSHAIAF